MTKLRLDDFEFGMRDHCFHYSRDITLVPGFNGLYLIYKGKRIKSNLSEEEALSEVENLITKTRKRNENQS